MLILIGRIIIIFYVAIITTKALRNPIRSVESCTNHSDQHLDLLTKESACYRYCDDAYFLIDKKSRETNRKLARAQLINKSDRSEKDLQCCCKFNLSWPDYVEPKAADVQVRRLTAAKGIQCLPLVMQLKISKRTRNSYNSLCNYLTKPGPLTMLEAVEFVEAASYLNYVRPKHPFILSILNLKEVRHLYFEEAKQFIDVVKHELLDSFKPLNQYDGDKLSFQTMDKFDRIRKFALVGALRSRIVAEAFDEYVVSYSLVDLNAAAKRVEKINKQSLELTDQVLSGDYDSYHLDGAKNYFTVDGINCKLLREVQNKLTRYLSHIKVTLSGLYEKLIYEHTAIKYRPLSELIETEKVYKNLWKVNCDVRRV